MSLTSPMDGIPYSIWRDFPHPHGPNEHGRGLVPFTEFEITLSRQILSYSFHRQQSYQQLLDSALLPPSGFASAGPPRQQERVVRELPKRARESVPQDDAVVGHSEEDFRQAAADMLRTDGEQVATTAFLDVPQDEDACTDGLESEVYDLENPSLFSHRATVQGLIDSFHRNALSPLAGTDVHEENGTIIVLTERPSPDTVDCALGKWEVEQEEHELEMRWRATKRVSENWLTRVRPVREQKEREREQGKSGGGAMGKLVAKDGAERQGDISWPQSHPLVQQIRAQAGASHGAPPSGARQTHAAQTPPYSLPPPSVFSPPSAVVAVPRDTTSAPLSAKHSSRSTTIAQPSTVTAPPTSTVLTTIPAPQSRTLAPSSTPVPPPLEQASEHTTDPPISKDPATPASVIDPATSAPTAHSPMTPSVPSPTTTTVLPLPAPASAIQPTFTAQPLEVSPPTNPRQPSPALTRPRPHTPYDPRAPYFKELPLSDLINIPSDSDDMQQLTFAGGSHALDSPREREDYQQPPRLAQVAQHVRYGHDSAGRVKCPCEIPSAPAALSLQPQSRLLGVPIPTSVASLPPNHSPAFSGNNEAALNHGPLAHLQSHGFSGSGNLSTPHSHSEHDGQSSRQSHSGPHNGTFKHPLEMQPPYSLTQEVQPDGRRIAIRRGPHVQAQALSEAPVYSSTSTSTPSEGNRTLDPHPRGHPHPSAPPHSLAYPPRGYSVPTHYHPYMTQQERNAAHDKIMRHIALLAQAPRITAGQVIVRNPAMTRASNLAPLFLALFPEYAGREMGTLSGGAARAGSAAKVWPDPGHSQSNLGSSIPQGQTMPSLESYEGIQLRQALIVAIQSAFSSPAAQQVPPPASTTRPVSPETPSASICTEPPRSDTTPRSILECAPNGKRLIPVAKAFSGDVLGPTYWFEPDAEAAEKLASVVNLLERSGGWRRPERKVLVVGGQRRARGPDDLLQ